MRVLHVIPGLTRQRGGPSTVVEALSRHQARMGHDVRVLTTNQGARHGETPTPLDPAVTLRVLPAAGPDRWAFAPGWRAVAREWLAWADVAHLHSIFTYPIHATARAALALRKPIILRPCGLLHPYSLRRSQALKAAYLRLWGDQFRASVTCWHYTSEAEQGASWPRGNRPSFVVPNGIEVDEFDVDRAAARQAVANRWLELGSVPYVLFLARLHPKKRADLLLRAFLATAPTPWKLVIAGPDERGAWQGLRERFLKASTDASRVVRIDAVHGVDKVHLLAGASWLALPSEHENFGNVVLEALATGTPALLSTEVDLATSVAETGAVLVAPPTLSAWRSLLHDAFLSPPADLVMQAARSWVAERYSWPRIVTELNRQYEACLEDNRSGARCLNRMRLQECV